MAGQTNKIRREGKDRLTEMDLLWLIGLSAVLTVVLVLVFSLLSDADLTTVLCERFGADVGGQLAGKVVWITGASTGIGAALALQTAKLGARIVISARREQLLGGTVCWSGAEIMILRVFRERQTELC